MDVPRQLDVSVRPVGAAAPAGPTRTSAAPAQHSRAPHFRFESCWARLVLVCFEAKASQNSRAAASQTATAVACRPARMNHFLSILTSLRASAPEEVSHLAALAKNTPSIAVVHPALGSLQVLDDREDRSWD